MDEHSNDSNDTETTQDAAPAGETPSSQNTFVELCEGRKILVEVRLGHIEGPGIVGYEEELVEKKVQYAKEEILDELECSLKEKDRELNKVKFFLRGAENTAQRAKRITAQHEKIIDDLREENATVKCSLKMAAATAQQKTSSASKQVETIDHLRAENVALKDNLGKTASIAQQKVLTISKLERQIKILSQENTGLKSELETIRDQLSSHFTDKDRLREVVRADKERLDLLTSEEQRLREEV